MAQKEVVADEKAVNPDSEKEVTIELDEKNQPIKPAEKPKAEEPKYVRPEDLEKERSKFYYNQRQLEKEIQELKSKLNEPRPAPIPPPPSGQVDELDEMLAKGDWRTPVERVVAKKYQELRQQEMESIRIQAEHQKNLELLENNKKKVMERYPELGDPDNEKTRLFQQIVQENPSYVTNPFGPVLAMNDMESRLRSEGKFIDAPIQQNIEKEVVRRARTNATSIPQSTVASSNKITLSKAQREFCDNNGIKYEQYARSLKLTGNQGGVEV